MKRTSQVKTAEEVRAEFNRRGKPFAAWAREHGYSPALVYKVMGGRIRGNCGQAHEICVLLGLKNGVIERRQAA